jgi:hypothetical protein
VTTPSSHDGKFFWIGEVPPKVLKIGAFQGRALNAADIVSELRAHTEVIQAPLLQWHVEGDRLRVAGSVIDPEAARGARVLVNHKDVAGEPFEHAGQIERWFEKYVPSAAIINPLNGTPPFRSKAAFFELTRHDPDLSRLVMPHQEIRSGEDVESAIQRFGFPMVVKADNLPRGRLMRLVHTRRELVRHIGVIRAQPTWYRIEALMQRPRSWVKRLLGRDARPVHLYKNTGRIIVNPFIETFDATLQGRLGMGIHFLGSQLTALRPRFMRQGWSNHDEQDESIGDFDRRRFHHLADRVLDAAERNRDAIVTLRRALRSWAIRLDTLIDPQGNVIVSEPGAKWGYKTHTFPRLCAEHGIERGMMTSRTGWNDEIDMRMLAVATSHVG